MSNDFCDYKRYDYVVDELWQSIYGGLISKVN